MLERITKTIHLKENPREKNVIKSESSKEEAIRKSYSLRSRKTESNAIHLVTKASNTFNNTTVNERYEQNNMRSKLSVPTWRKHSKGIFNTRKHTKTSFRPVKPNVLFSKSNSNEYGGGIADKNDAITDDAQKGCVNGNENFYDHHRGLINNDVNIICENVAEEFHDEENNIYVDDEQGGMQHNLLYNHRDVNLPQQTYTTAPVLAFTNPSF